METIKLKTGIICVQKMQKNGVVRVTVKNK